MAQFATATCNMGQSKMYNSAEKTMSSSVDVVKFDLRLHRDVVPEDPVFHQFFFYFLPVFVCCIENIFIVCLDQF